MIHRYIFFLILGVDALILLFQTSYLSISYDEALLLYGNFSFLQFLLKASLSIFGSNDLGLRFVMIIFHILSAILMYEISKDYIKHERDRLWLLLVFILLPGVVSSALIVNSAGMIIFGLLLFIYLSKKVSQSYLNIFLFFLSLTDIGFAYLFLGLSVYYILQKKIKLFMYVISLYLLTSFLYGFEITGSPRGHFLDTIGVYGVIFTPIIFIYLFYALYRRYLTSKEDMIWYISATTLIISLLLSFRQRIPLEHFAPYLIVALPLAGHSFISSYRVRLKVYRTPYKLAFILSLIFLISNTLLVFFNEELYAITKNPKRHFAYENNVAKELAINLKEKGIDCVKTDNRMQIRLKFYAIDYCKNIILEEINLETNTTSNVTVSYKRRPLYRANVTILNNI